VASGMPSVYMYVYVSVDARVCMYMCPPSLTPEWLDGFYKCSVFTSLSITGR
jgi:hypothetical protein